MANTQPTIDYSPGRHDARLLAATTQLLQDGNSFTELSVELIANTAGLSRATFYLHYKDKAALVEQLARASATDIIDATDHWRAWAHLGYRADVRETMRQVVEIYEANRTVMNLLVELSSYDSRIGPIYAALLKVIIGQIETSISQAQESGLTHNSINPGTASFIVYGVERQCYFQSKTAGQDRSPHLIDAITDAIWRFVYDPAKAPPYDAVPQHASK